MHSTVGVGPAEGRPSDPTRTHELSVQPFLQPVITSLSPLEPQPAPRLLAALRRAARAGMLGGAALLVPHSSTVGQLKTGTCTGTVSDGHSEYERICCASVARIGAANHSMEPKAKAEPFFKSRVARCGRSLFCSRQV